MRALKRLADKPFIGAVTKLIMRHLLDQKVDDISSHFSTYFFPKVADSNQLLDQAFRVRHQVYCDELKFLEKHPSGRETDKFDEHSLHCLIEHKERAAVAGTVRMVYSTNESEKLPLEEYCPDAISENQIHPSNFKREEICEISRLAVPAEFRRRNADKLPNAATGEINEQTYSETELRCFPFIAVGLYLSGASMAINTGRNHCFVMMEPRLARSLRFVGITFTQIGPTIEYHGQRAPYYISSEMLMKSLSGGFKKMLKHIGNDIVSQNPQIS